MEVKSIENFFLSRLLLISICGLSIVIISNLVFYPEDLLSITISIALFGSCVVSYRLRHKNPTTAVVLCTTVALIAMAYQRLVVPNTTTTLATVLIVGFIFSVMLKGRLMLAMHGFALLIINTTFVFHLPDAITAAITYSTLYFILAYGAATLKISYDQINLNLKESNIQLSQKTQETAAQNQELVKVQQHLNSLNNDLERLVTERTVKIQLQNEMLVKYSYSNAHHLRGPVARLLGLASVYNIDPNQDPNFFIGLMVQQAHEIDSVVKQINLELVPDYNNDPSGLRL